MQPVLHCTVGACFLKRCAPSPAPALPQALPTACPKPDRRWPPRRTCAVARTASSRSRLPRCWWMGRPTLGWQLWCRWDDPCRVIPAKTGSCDSLVCCHRPVCVFFDLHAAGLAAGAGLLSGHALQLRTGRAPGPGFASMKQRLLCLTAPCPVPPGTAWYRPAVPVDASGVPE